VLGRRDDLSFRNTKARSGRGGFGGTVKAAWCSEHQLDGRPFCLKVTVSPHKRAMPSWSWPTTARQRWGKASNSLIVMSDRQIDLENLPDSRGDRVAPRYQPFNAASVAWRVT
jgi:hypothetical protein